MARRKGGAEKLVTAFAQTQVQVTEQKNLLEEIQTLRQSNTELSTSKSELEQHITQLREQLKAQEGVQDLLVEAIERNPKQPRQTFDEEGMQKLARSLSIDGQQEPIIVFRKGTQSILLDGERRWRCAKNRLDWQTIQAVIIPEPEDLHRKVLIATLHRQDINILDRSEAIASEILRQSGMEGETMDSLSTLLNTVVTRLRKHKRINEIVNVVDESLDKQTEVLEQLERAGEFKKTEEPIILRTLLSLQQNPASFSSAHLPALSMPEELKKAVREGGLGLSQAQELAKINADALPNVAQEKVHQLRLDALEKVLYGWDRDGENPRMLTVRETKIVVKTVIEQNNPKKRKAITDTEVKSKMKAMQAFTIGDGIGLKVETLEDYQKLLEAKLREVKAALAVRDN